MKTLDDLPAYWAIFITRPRYAGWSIEARVWIDNGQGGRQLSLTSTSLTLANATRRILDKIAEHEKMFGERYH